MSKHNTHFHDNVRKVPKVSIKVCFLELSEEFPMDSNIGSNEPW